LGLDSRKYSGKDVHTNSVILICLLLVLVTLAVYMQVGSHQFLNLDDPSYVTENPHVLSGITVNSVSWAFSSVDAGNWHPITWLSHLADVQLYGVNPRGHHLTNVVIHILSSVLLLLFLLRASGSLWQSSFVAALFALHPLHVESVAWVAERKDVLSAFFGFAALFFYAEYVAKQETKFYLLSFVLFLLGLMSKPMLVTLPIVMLLMDFWPLERYPHAEPQQRTRISSGPMPALIKEKIPFFACSLVSGLVTIYAQQKGGATSSLTGLPFIVRLENALVAYVTYLIKTLWPSDLAVLYPFPLSLPLWQVIGSLLLLSLVTVVTLKLSRRHPFLAMGWFWFLITLVPVIGLVQVGSQAMADRYAYLPAIGLFIMVAWGVPILAKDFKYRTAMLSLLAGAVIVASAAVTWQQLGYWRDNISLYRHALAVTSGSYLVHSNLGVALDEKGDLDSAISEYREAIRISPEKFDAHGNLGLALIGKGDLDGAVRECQAALRLSPANSNSHYNLGVALAQKGDLDAAIGEYLEAIRISPAIPKMHSSLGLALVKKGELEGAIAEFQKVLQIRPGDGNAHYNLAVTLANKGDLDAAIEEFQNVIRINPADTYALNNLERALAQKKMGR
jgi:protein O-mannosyl-transferase